MTQRARFTQSDIAKALKGMKQAGETPSSIEITPDGRIIAKFGQPGETGGDDGDEWMRRINAKGDERAAGKRH